MAMYVHQTLEEMIPELEEMNQLGLFTVKETKVILRNRESLEYRLRQLTKIKPSYLNYIEYEKKLLELLKIRRKKMANDSKKREIEKSIADRIHSLYRFACTRFQGDISIWQQHIDFSKALREKAYVTRLYNKALKIHGHLEDLWVQSARWERSQDGNNNPQLARELLLKGHRVNPESEVILLEMFRMELELARNILKRKSILGMGTKETPKESEGEEKMEDEAESEEEEGGDEFKLAQIVYKQAIKLLSGNAKFHLKLLSVCSKCSEARALQNTICDDLRQLYPANDSVWEGLAWVNLTFFDKMDQDLAKAAVHRFLKVYEEAFQQLETTEELLGVCLRSHLNLLDKKSLSPSLRETVLRSMLTYFQHGVQTQTLSEWAYQGLIDTMVELNLSDDVKSVLEWGTKQHPSSANLWLARLQTLGDDTEAMTACLDQALSQVHPNATWGLWIHALSTLAASTNVTELDSLIDRACRWSDPSVACYNKNWALYYAVRQRGIKHARRVYQQWKRSRPISVEFFKTALQAEQAQPKPDLDYMRSVLEEALLEFGQTEPELWLNYMVFESSVAGQPQRAGAVEQRALNALQPNLKEGFIRKNIGMKLQKREK